MMLAETQSQQRQLFRKRIELDIGKTSSAIQLATTASSNSKPKAKPAHGSYCIGSLCVGFGETKTNFQWKSKSKSKSKTTKPSKKKDEMWSTIIIASIIVLVLISNKIIKSSILALTYYEKNYTITETVDRVEKRTVWLQFFHMTLTPVYVWTSIFGTMTPNEKQVLWGS
jgi:hypothetical protein